MLLNCIWQFWHTLLSDCNSTCRNEQKAVLYSVSVYQNQTWLHKQIARTRQLTWAGDRWSKSRPIVFMDQSLIAGNTRPLILYLYSKLGFISMTHIKQMENECSMQPVNGLLKFYQSNITPQFPTSCSRSYQGYESIQKLQRSLLYKTLQSHKPGYLYDLILDQVNTSTNSFAMI